MSNVLIFGGTTEGRMLSEEFAKHGIAVTYCVATAYGCGVMAGCNRMITIKVGRLSQNEMAELISSAHFEYVIDATHPYAVEATKSIRHACQEVGQTYLRLIRTEGKEYDCCTYVDNIQQACKCSAESGNILVVTGSKQIAEFSIIKGFADRVYARVLPSEESIALCMQAGLSKDHVILHFGACSMEENVAVIRNHNIKTLITKDGGIAGGFEEKVQACRITDTKCIVIKRPSEPDGYSAQELINMVMEGGIS